MPNSIDRRQFLIGASAVAALAGLSACGNSSGTPVSATSGNPRVVRTASKKQAVYAQSVQITSLETAGGQPQVYPAGYEAAFAVYSGLIRFGDDLSFQPDLATAWKVADDQVTWTFTLRSGVTFHDGTPFNADAVVAHFTRMLDKTQNLAAYTLWQPIARVVKVDDKTVNVITSRPYGALLNTMAHGSALIPSPAAVAKYGTTIGLHPVGTGPYQLDSFQPGSKLVLKANPGYFGDKPVYDSITYYYVGDSAGRIAALQSGQADIIDAVPVEQAKQIASSGNLNLINIAGLQVFGIGLNQTNPLLTDKQVRQAMNYAIDKDAIVASLFRGYATVMNSPLAPKTTGHAECGSYRFDVKKAKSMLAAAGCTAGPDGVLVKDGKRLSFRLRTPDGMYPNDTQVAQVIQDQLKTVGVEVTIQKVDKSSFWNSILVPQDKVDFDLVLFGYNPSHASGALQLDALYLSNPSPASKPRQWNFNWYHNSQVDTLIQQAESTVDEGGQRSLLEQAQKLLWDDAPYIWLYTKNNLSAYNNKVATPVVLPVVFTLPSRAPQAR